MTKSNPIRIDARPGAAGCPGRRLVTVPRRARGVLAVAGLALAVLLTSAAAEEKAGFADGMAQYKKKEYKQAAETLRVALAAPGLSDQQQHDGLLALAASYENLGKPIAALNTYRKYLEQFPDSQESAMARRSLGRCNEAAGRFIEAITAYKEYLARFGGRAESADVRYQIASVYEECLGKNREAIQEYRDLVSVDTNKERRRACMKRIAELWEAERNFPVAIREFRTYLTEYPTDQDTWEHLVWVYEERMKDYGEAAKTLEEILAKFPKADNRYELFMRLGDMYRDRLRKFKEAALAYGEAFKSRPTADAKLRMVRCLSEAGDEAAFVGEAQALIKQFGQSPEVRDTYVLLTNFYRQQKKPAEAVKTAADMVAALKSEDAGDLNLLGIVQYEAGQFPQAQATFEKLIALDPKFGRGDAHIWLSRALRSQKQDAKAEEILKQGAKDLAKDGEAYNKLMWTLGQEIYEPQKKWDDAIAAYLAIYQQYPGSGWWSSVHAAGRRIAECCAQKGDVLTAYDLFVDLFKKNPYNNNLQECLKQMIPYLEKGRRKDTADGIRAMIKTVKEKEDLINKERAQADNLMNQQKYQEACDAYQKILKENKDQIDANWYRWRIVWDLCVNRWRNMEMARKLALEYYKDSGESRWLTISIDLCRNYDPRDYAKAIELLQEAAKRDDVDAWWATVAACDTYTAARQPADAANWVETWIGKNPKDARMPEAMYRAGTARLGTGNPRAALKWYQKLQAEFPNHNWTLEGCFRVRESVPGDFKVEMLTRWLKDNPNHWENVRACLALGNTMEGEVKDLAKAAEYYELGCGKFARRNDWNTMQCFLGLARVYEAQKKTAEQMATLQRMVDTLGQNRWGEIQQAWMTLLGYYRTQKRPVPFLIDFCDKMQTAWPGTDLSLTAGFAKGEILAASGDVTGGLIAWHKAILSSTDDRRSWVFIVKYANDLMDKGEFETAAVLLRTLLNHNDSVKDKERRDVEAAMSNCYYKIGGTLVTIDEKSPEAPLLMGDILAQQGEDEIAWDRYLKNKALFDTVQHKLSPTYIHLIAHRLMLQKRGSESVQICRDFFIKRANDKHVSASDRAGMQLLIGQNYLQEERYELARAEFETCKNLYPNTPEAVDAEFKIGECYVNQKNYDKALEIFEKLSTDKNKTTASKGLLMMGVTYFEKGDLETAREKFREVLELNPSEELSNRVFFEMGDIYLKRAKYTEAKNLFDLVGSGGGAVKRVIQPGRELKIRLHDRDLNVTRGADTIPIIIESSNGDKEKVSLTVSEVGSGVFVGSVETRLGDPKPDNDVLELMGNDVITYNYAPEFRAQFMPAQLRHPEIRVASDAELEASATEILTKDEKARRAEEEALRRQLGQFQQGRTQFRRADEFKPGNFIYVQVEDPDMDTTAGKDTVKVLVKATSGDSVEAELTETEAHSGIFRGKVQTSDRPPYAFASDSAENCAPDNAIDGDPSPASCWIGKYDRQKPKWLAVDLMNVYPVGRVVWRRGKGADDRKLTNYIVQVSYDGKFWRSAATWPTENVETLIGNYGELQLRVVKPGGRLDSNDLAGLQRGIKDSKGVLLQERRPGIDEDKYAVAVKGEYVGMYYGYVYAPRDGTYTFGLKTNNRSPAYVVVNRDYVVGTDRAFQPGQNARGLEFPYQGRIRLAKGAHQITVFYHAPRGDSKVVVGWTLPGGGRMEAIPDEFFSAKKYPEITKAIEDAGLGQAVSVKPLEGEVGADISLGNIQARYVRLLINDYEGDAPAVANIEIFDGKGNKIIPPAVDVHSLATNQIVEVGPGDEVLVSYRDLRTVKNEPGTTLIGKLRATFYNGEVAAIKHVFTEDERGNKWKRDFRVFRVDPGDRFIVEVRDYDEDVTDGLDTVAVKVRTSGGAELDVKCQETEPYTGVFNKEVDCTADGRPGTLKVKPGEEIIIEYYDKWNTNPGNPTTREAIVYVNEPTAAQFRIIETRGFVDKTGRKGWSPVPADQTGDKETKTVSLAAPLIVHVVDRDMAKSEEDEVTVKLKTDPGGDTAEVTCKLVGQDALVEGRFTGQIPLLLGDATSMDYIVETANLQEGVIRRAQQTKKKEDESVIPVINASGQDVIIATYTDQRWPGGNAPRDLTDKARLVSTGKVRFTRNDYEEETKEAHVGEKLYMRVDDGDADTTPERDTVTVDLAAASGDKITLQLTETLGHSGVFTGSIVLAMAKDKNPADEIFEAGFGDTVVMTYVDKQNADKPEPVTIKAEVQVVVGTDGTTVAFGRKFKDEDMAVQTQFKIAECYFELAKDHLQLKKDELANEEMADGQKILTETLEEFPDNQYAYQALYLMANLARERGNYDEAIKAYRKVVRDYGDTSAGPLAQYQLAICYEKKGDFDKATDEYVRLAYNYPDSELVSDCIIRLGEYFYQNKDFKTAIDVFNKFVERYPKHQLADRVYMRVGHCWLLLARDLQAKGTNTAEIYTNAAKHFDEFNVKFPQSSVDYRAQSLYWAGDSWLKANNPLFSYRRFKNCVWNFPETEWARHARGRLTAPIFEKFAEQD